MFIKDDYKIKILNQVGIELKGYFCEKDTSCCVIGFAGLGGTCDNMFCAIASRVVEKGMSFLFGNTQASYKIKELNQHTENGEVKAALRGGAYENYDDTINDMICWINFAMQQGFETIYLVGASLACNRLISMLNIKYIPQIKKLILICPQDMHKQIDYNMLKEAEENIMVNESEKLLSSKVFGYCEICGRTYKELFTRKDVNNLPYLSTTSNFSLFNKVNIPIFSVIGSKDQGLSYSNLSAVEAMEILRKNNNNFEFEIVDGATHSFKGFEDRLAEIISIYLENVK